MDIDRFGRTDCYPVISAVLTQHYLYCFTGLSRNGKKLSCFSSLRRYLGLTLGATPTAIANMTAVTEHFGASPQAFIIVPLVGAFFIDLSNAFIIQQFLNFLT